MMTNFFLTTLSTFSKTLIMYNSSENITNQLKMQDTVCVSLDVHTPLN